MIKLYFTIKVLVLVVIISIMLLLILFILLKSKLDSIFKKNCYKCKQYNLFDVASVGDGCRYKCNKYNRIDRSGMNTRVHYEKCNEFESK